MAITGVALIGFVIAHLVGNLQIFLGQQTFNDYAEFLKSMPAFIWTARIGLIVIVIVHVVTAICLTRSNRAARPVDYRAQATVQASAASRYMTHSGLIILIFIVVHLLHFTIGELEPQYFALRDSTGRHDVYSMLVHGFQMVPYSVGYIIAMLCLGAHLSHAISSMFQTLGICGPKLTPMIKKAAGALSILIVLGYVSIPLGVLSGIVGLPMGGGS